MLSETYFFRRLDHKLRGRLTEAAQLSARIRRTENGARIKFSDGRVTWLEKEACISESAFLSSVSQWAQRHGAKSIHLE